MMRAIALAARLDFTIDAPVLAAIRRHRHEIARSSPARLLEEYYKILRAGSAEKTFRWLADVGLLEPISAELHRGAGDALWRSLNAHRRLPASVRLPTPETLTNAILLGQPPGAARDFARVPENGRAPAVNADRARPGRGSASCRWRGATSSGCGKSSACSGGCATSARAPAPSGRSSIGTCSATR